MKTLFQIGLSALSLAPICLQAQSTGYANRAELLKNPDVLWVGEATVPYLLDLNDPTRLKSDYLKSVGIVPRYNLVTLKTQCTRNSPYYLSGTEELNLAARLFHRPTIKAMECYADPELKTRLTAEQAVRLLESVDTLPIAGINQVVVKSVSDLDVWGYHAKQLFYFDKKNNRFGALTEAIAPVCRKQGAESDADSQPLFWIKVKNDALMQDLNNPDVPWARQTLNQLEFASLKALKQDKTWQECLKIHFEELTKNTKATDVRVLDDQLSRATPQHLSQMFTTIDTIITFDPVNKTEQIQVQKNEFKPEMVEKVRFITEWVWNHKNRQLQCFVRFSGTILPYNDDQGRFLFEAPLYYKAF